MCCSFKFLAFLLTILHSRVCLSLRDVQINVPQAVIRGREAVLQCTFDLEGEKLYSLKWYQGKFEFFRYTPMEQYPIKVFPLAGVRVKMPESRPTRIVLENVSREGPFVCEVTAEKPSFFTVVESAELKVVDLPKSDPQISNLELKYPINSLILQANCTSGYSYPAVNLTWYINSVPIRGSHVTYRVIHYKHYFIATSSIRYRLNKKKYSSSPKLRCSASLYDVYLRSADVIVNLEEWNGKIESSELPVTTKAPPPLKLTTEPYIYYDNGNDYGVEEDYEEHTTMWSLFKPFTRSASQRYSSTVAIVVSSIPVLIFLS